MRSRPSTFLRLAPPPRAIPPNAAAVRRPFEPTQQRGGERAVFYFDIASPYTYLAAERADRMFSRLTWLPAAAKGLGSPALTTGERCAIGERADRLGMPLIWPIAPDRPAVGAMRVASLAQERGRGALFVLASCRLQFCGAYDIEDPEVLAEAAAAAGLDLDDMLSAAMDAGRDVAIERDGGRLLAAGADRLPVLRVGASLFCGEERLVEAAAA